MKKNALTSSLLLAGIFMAQSAFARHIPEIDKSHVRSIVYALFSYNEQKDKTSSLIRLIGR